MPEVTDLSAALASSTAPPPTSVHAALAVPASVAGAASLAVGACGGGGSDSGTPPAPPPAAITDATASRFLAQASMGATRSEIDKVKSLGYAGWLDMQFALATDTTRWDWLVAKGYYDIANKNGQSGFDPVAWRKLIASPDTLRQRVTLALSEIIVVSIDGLQANWKTFGGAAWLDLLERHAFGNLRSLLGEVSTSLQMGLYLTFKGNAKANATKGSLPDENYARELMQLFTIGLSELNADGTEELVGGKSQDTYGPADIGGLARVFTGWEVDLAGGNTDTPDYHKRPMTQVASRYETGEKVFLGLTIPAGTDAPTTLKMALDHLFAHANVAPFWSRQLIQRLVTSNPSPAYVQRVSAVFANDGTGQRGNLKAVLRALLLDDEARSGAALTDAKAGKLREPILRLTAWARAFGANSPSDAWAIGNTSDPATRLGQSPLHSPSVFNFFRPGYVPPNSGIGSAALVAPEFQITNESSVVGYLNFMQTVVSAGRGDTKADYSALLPLADDAVALVAEIDLLLAAGQLGDATRKTISDAVGTITTGTDAKRLSRIYAAVVLVLGAPEFLVLK
jgi:uncharacterized protein (DUF1800 family)